MFAFFALTECFFDGLPQLQTSEFSAGFAGMIRRLHPDDGAKMPEYLTMLKRGGGTNAASFSMNSTGS
jgi:hypothetical protein